MWWPGSKSSKKASTIVWCALCGMGTPTRCASSPAPSPPRRRHGPSRPSARRPARTNASGSEDTLFLAGWVLVITSLPAQHWSTQQVLALYRARWQIELVYKRMKQLLRLNQLRGHRPETNEATILAEFVAWALQEQEAQQARALLAQAAACWQAQDATTAPTPAGPNGHDSEAEGELQPPISSWLLTSLCLHTLRQVVQGYWTFERLRACLPVQQRFVRGSPRTRQQQEQMIRALRSSLIAADPARKGSVFSWSSA